MHVSDPVYLDCNASAMRWRGPSSKGSVTPAPMLGRLTTEGEVESAAAQLLAAARAS